MEKIYNLDEVAEFLRRPDETLKQARRRVNTICKMDDVVGYSQLPGNITRMIE
jgi:hypothetical protein